MNKTPATVPARPGVDRLAAGEEVGRYAIVERIGAGGMGQVYIAHDPQLDRNVALKVLRADLEASGGRGRLTREAQAMAKLSHANVIGVYDAGVFEDARGDERLFIAMELVEGEELRDWLKRIRKTDDFAKGHRVGEILERFLAAGEGLAAAHAAGIVHRDFKPANVLVDGRGHVRVGDFGLARPLSEVAEGAPLDLEALADVELDLTRTEDMIGTPGYMAPELYESSPADARSDQFAFCVSLFEALWGVRPVPGEHVNAIVLATLQGRMREPPEQPPVSNELRRIVLRGLDKDPDARWPDMRALLDALERERDRPSRRRRAAAAVAVVGAIAVAYVVGAFERPAAPPPVCADAAARASEVWNDGRRAQTRSALEHVDASFAERSASATVIAVNGYAARLTEGYAAACDASLAADAVPGRRERVDACLDRRALALDVLLRELGEADARVLERASQAVEGLPSVVGCSSEPLEAAPPSDQAEEVLEVRRTLASSRAKVLAGRFDMAVEEAEASRGRADEIGFAPLVHEAALVHGVALRSRGRFEPAYGALRDAALGALRGERDEVLVEAATALVDVAGVRLSHPEEADLWGELAAAALARQGPRPMAEARLARERARLRSATGERDEAIQEARRAVALVESARGSDSLALAGPLAQLGDTLARMRDFRGALRPLRRLDLLLRDRLDASHPERIAAAVRLSGALLYAQADRLECRALIDDAREQAMRHLPPDHPVRARALTRRGDVLALSGEAEASIAEYARALEATRMAYGDEHTEVARVMLNLAGARARHGDVDGAIAQWREALALRERLLGEEHPDLAIVLQNIGSVQVERGEASAALPDLARAHEIRHSRPASAQARADADYWYGRALYETGDRARGRPMVEEAERVSRELGYLDPAGDMARWLEEHP